MGQVLPWIPLKPWLIPLIQRDVGEGDGSCALPLSLVVTSLEGPTQAPQCRTL